MVPPLDDRLFHAIFGRGDCVPLTVLAQGFSAIGGGWGMLAIAPLTLRKETRRLAVWITGMLAGAAVLVFALKAIVARGRPYTAYHGLEKILLDSPTDFSFPSGHATGAFATALFLSRLLLDQRPRPRYARLQAAALILAASCVAVSRIVLGFHFPIDVLAGTLLGSTIGGLVGRRYVETSR